MGVFKKEALQSTVISYVGILLAYTNIVFLFPLFLPAEYIGLLSMLVDTAGLFSFYVMFGLNTALIKFLPDFNKTKESLNNFFNLVTYFPLIGFAIFASVIFFGKDFIVRKFSGNASLFVDFYIWVIPLTFFLIYTAFFETIASIFLKVSFPKFLKEIFLRITIGLSIILYYFKVIDIEGMVNLYCLSFGLNMLLVYIYIIINKNINYSPTFNVKLPDAKMTRQIIVYCSFIVLGSVGSTLVGKIDSVMLSSLSGLSDFGIYKIAFSLAIVIELPLRSFNMISSPLVATYHDQKDYVKMLQLYKKTSMVLTVTGMLIFLLIWINIDNFYELMPNGQIYAVGKWVVFYIGLSKVFDLLTSINSLIITTSIYYRYSLYLMTFLAVSAIISNYLLIPVMGIVGAAIATALSIFLYNLLSVLVVKWKFGIQPFDLKMLWVLLLGAGCIVLNVLSPHVDNYWLDGIIRTVVCVSVFSFVVLKLRLSEDINLFGEQLLNRIQTFTRVKR